MGGRLAVPQRPMSSLESFKTVYNEYNMHTRTLRNLGIEKTRSESLPHQDGAEGEGGGEGRRLHTVFGGFRTSIQTASGAQAALRAEGGVWLQDL